MDFYQALINEATPVDILPSSTSYFSTPETILDPRLFRNHKIIPSVRDGILATLYGFLNHNFQSPDAWTVVWLAGSGVSYQWAAHRDPGDLDCLVGIDYVLFRQSNADFKGLSNQEIASMFNDIFRTELWPQTENYLGSFELTFYVNVETDITKIRPYAAYSLTTDSWTVEPGPSADNIPQEWEHKAQRDHTMARDIVKRYQDALNALENAKGNAARLNAETALRLAVSQGTALFEDIHKGRSAAFSPSGKGYSDYANYRWQYGKEAGVVQALRHLKDIEQASRKASEISLYGSELPSAATLVRRAALNYRSK